MTEDLEANIKRKLDDLTNIIKLSKIVILRNTAFSDVWELRFFFSLCHAFILITDYCVIETFLRKGHQSVLYKSIKIKHHQRLFKYFFQY